jgi:hypothetical protein
VAAGAILHAQNVRAAATALEQQAADSAVIDSLDLHCTELQEALARSSNSSSSEAECVKVKSEHALQQLQQEHSAEVTRLQSELAALQQQLDQQVHLTLVLYIICSSYTDLQVVAIVASIVRCSCVSCGSTL